MTFKVILSLSEFRVPVDFKSATAFELRQVDRMKGNPKCCNHWKIKNNTPQNWGNSDFKKKLRRRSKRYRSSEAKPQVGKLELPATGIEHLEIA